MGPSSLVLGGYDLYKIRLQSAIFWFSKWICNEFMDEILWNQWHNNLIQPIGVVHLIRNLISLSLVLLLFKWLQQANIHRALMLGIYPHRHVARTRGFCTFEVLRMAKKQKRNDHDGGFKHCWEGSAMQMMELFMGVAQCKGGWWVGNIICWMLQALETKQKLARRWHHTNKTI